MSINEIASIVAGGIVTILVTISVEVLRRPKLRMAPANATDATYGGDRPERIPGSVLTFQHFKGTLC